jgi:hypothetical protein
LFTVAHDGDPLLACIALPHGPTKELSMLGHLITASALVLAAGAFAGSQAHADDHRDQARYRIFVGDHAQPVVTAFDLSAPQRRWTFTTQGQAKLYAVADGSVVAAVQSDADAVQLIRSGIRLHQHGDHQDLVVEDPAPILTSLEGPRPFHLVDHAGKIVINYDLGGYAEILDARALAEGKVVATRFPQSRPHHGFVAPLGEHWLSTVASDEPTKDGAAPARLGLRAFKPDGTPASDLAACAAIHGEAFSGVYLAAGCREGVLTVTADQAGLAFRMLAYPAGLPQGVTTGTLLGSTAMQVFLGNHGADGLVVVDPAEAPHVQRIGLSFRRIDFTLDPARPGIGYVLTEDGTMHRIDMLAARIAASAKVVQPYSMDGHWNDPRPRLAVAGDEIIVTDPRSGLIRRIEAESLQEAGTIAIEGLPYNVVVVSGSGMVH